MHSKTFPEPLQVLCFQDAALMLPFLFFFQSKKAGKKRLLEGSFSVLERPFVCSLTFLLAIGLLCVIFFFSIGREGENISYSFRRQTSKKVECTKLN